MKKLRIALWNNLPSGGGKRAFFELARGLKARGHYLESWCPPTAHRDYLPLESLMPEHVVGYDDSAFIPRYPWDRVGIHYKCFNKQFSAMNRHCKDCADEIDARDFDVLLATNCWHFAVPSIGRYIKTPAVIYSQEPRRHLYEARPKLPWSALPSEENRIWPYSAFRSLAADYNLLVSKRVEVREEFDSIHAFGTVLVNSSFSREAMTKTYGIDSKVCYLGVDTQIFKPIDVEKENYIIGLGAFQPHKGIDTAIEAVSKINPQIRPKLVWIGNLSNSEYFDDINRLANRLQVELETLQLVSDEILVDALNKSLMMIYTSVLEPFGFAPLEANACGVPVVAIAEGGVRETVKHNVNGLLVLDRDANALAAQVERLLVNRGLAKDLGENGLKAIKQHWSWDQSAEKLESHLYRQI